MSEATGFMSKLRFPTMNFDRCRVVPKTSQWRMQYSSFRTNISDFFRYCSLNGWGASLVDSLDTMIIMGLNDITNRSKRHVAQLTFDKVCRLTNP